MSTRARGVGLQHATPRRLIHRYTGWVHAESTPNGRAGRDILGTPGVWFEVKTGWKDSSPQAEVWKTAAAAGDDVPVVIFWPRGIGERQADRTIALLPAPVLLRLLVEAGYAPQPKEES